MPLAEPDEPEPAAVRLNSAAPPDDLTRIDKLLLGQLGKFMALVPKILSTDQRRPVHDLRVSTRRLQQLLRVRFADPQSRKVRSLLGAFRRARRALGEWRICDVVLDQLAASERRRRRSETRAAWALVREHVISVRERETRRARKRLLKLELLRLVQNLKKLLDGPAGERTAATDESLRATIRSAHSRWQAALALAVKAPKVENVHAFRIEMKRLRYSIELADDLGVPGTKPVLDWLKSLQEAQGRWHDHRELDRMIVRALAEPEVLLAQTRTAVFLLTQVERGRVRDGPELKRLLSAATEGPERAEFDGWLVRYFEPPAEPAPSPAPPPSVAEPADAAGQPPQVTADKESQVV